MHLSSFNLRFPCLPGQAPMFFDVDIDGYISDNKVDGAAKEILRAIEPALRTGLSNMLYAELSLAFSVRKFKEIAETKVPATAVGITTEPSDQESAAMTKEATAKANDYMNGGFLINVTYWTDATHKRNLSYSSFAEATRDSSPQSQKGKIK